MKRTDFKLVPEPLQHRFGWSCRGAHRPRSNRYQREAIRGPPEACLHGRPGYSDES